MPLILKHTRSRTVANPKKNHILFFGMAVGGSMIHFHNHYKPSKSYYILVDMDGVVWSSDLQG